MRNRGIIAIAVMLGLGICSYASAARPPVAFDDDWEKRRWIAKVAATLRNGRGISPADHIEELLKKSSTELFDHFISSPDFGDTALNFNLSFLGYQPQYLRDAEGALVDTVTKRASAFAYPGAVSSAQELLREGDYLKLFDYVQDVYTGPLRAPEPLADHPDYTVEQLREYYFSQGAELMDKAIAVAEKGMPEHQNEYCDLLSNIRTVYGELRKAGVPNNLDYHLTFRDSSPYYTVAYGLCQYKIEWQPGFLDTLKAMRADYPNLVKKLRELHPDNYKDRSVAGMRRFDAGPVWSTGIAPALSPFMWIELQNSSTNFERKRGAYMLKHFFCDDLTPVNVVVPSDHSQGQHGSEPSCYACHYKLDPMSGFFRTIGVTGRSYEGKPYIRFDDGVMSDIDAYLANWKADPATGRKWEVGYVRSSQYSQLNTYGDSIEDLFRIIREAPEAKRCIVRRMFEHFIGENQTVDAGYLNYLADGFIAGSRVNSSKAFKDTLYKLVTSNAFMVQDPRQGECYDYAPGTNPANKPPCRVSYLFQKNCATCHSGAGPAAGLDLTAWITTADGSMSFPHRTSAGGQHTRSETMALIQDRMTTANTALRMPFNRYISSEDQVEMLSWVSSQAARKRGVRK